jgi:hypothetical protein
MTTSGFALEASHLKLAIERFTEINLNDVTPAFVSFRHSVREKLGHAQGPALETA